MEINDKNDLESELVRTIPMDLLPHRVEQMNNEWAEKTFKYCHLFNSSINYTAFDKNSNDIMCWLETASNLVNELKKLGVIAGEEHVVQLAKETFRLKMMNTDTIEPASVSDILSIYENKWYYKKNRDEILKQVYSMTYALGRNGTNGWALAVERFILSKYKIKYGTELITKCVKRRHKGCFYQYIVMRFSKTNTRRFQNTLETNHQEYLTAKKKSMNTDIGIKFEWMKFGEGGVWLVRNQNFKHEETLNKDTKLSLIDQGQEWVKECIAVGYTCDFLKQKVISWATTNMLEQNTNYANEGTTIHYFKLFLTKHNFDNVDSHV